MAVKERCSRVVGDPAQSHTASRWDRDCIASDRIALSFNKWRIDVGVVRSDIEGFVHDLEFVATHQRRSSRRRLAHRCRWKGWNPLQVSRSPSCCTHASQLKTVSWTLDMCGYAKAFVWAPYTFESNESLPIDKAVNIEGTWGIWYVTLLTTVRLTLC